MTDTEVLEQLQSLVDSALLEAEEYVTNNPEANKYQHRYYRYNCFTCITRNFWAIAGRINNYMPYEYLGRTNEQTMKNFIAAQTTRTVTLWNRRPKSQ